MQSNGDVPRGEIDDVMAAWGSRALGLTTVLYMDVLLGEPCVYYMLLDRFRVVAAAIEKPGIV